MRSFPSAGRLYILSWQDIQGVSSSAASAFLAPVRTGLSVRHTFCFLSDTTLVRALNEGLLFPEDFKFLFDLCEFVDRELLLRHYYC